MEVDINESICKSELHGKLLKASYMVPLYIWQGIHFKNNRLLAKVKHLLEISSILGVPTSLEYFSNITNGQSGTKNPTKTWVLIKLEKNYRF